MIKEVKLPEISENVEHGDVIKVLVKTGDSISKDQPIIELETEKATFEVPSTEEGIIKEILVKEGDVIDIGAVIIKVETDSKNGSADSDKDENSIKESKEKDKKESKDESKKEEIKEEIKEDDVNEEEDEENKQESKEEDEEGKETESKDSEDESDKEDNLKSELVRPGESNKLIEKIKNKDLAPASPSVRRLARELGVEVSDVTGTGKSGRITEDDVKLYVKSLMEGADSETGSTALRSKALPDFSKYGEISKEPMSKVRSITAESMTYAWTTPMVTQFDKADITLAEEFRKKYAKSVESKGGHLTITSLLVKICTEALKKFPQFNSSIDVNKKEIIYKKYFNVGIAVDTDRGLLVPVIRDTDKKTITDISAELNNLAEKARTKKITPDEMDGGNFTISNLGGIGGTAFTPIVYSPQVAILGVSRASIEAVYINGNFEPKMMMPLMLTYDHRIIDGADAARFLRWICEVLENPMTILL